MSNKRYKREYLVLLPPNVAPEAGPTIRQIYKDVSGRSTKLRRSGTPAEPQEAEMAGDPKQLKFTTRSIESVQVSRRLDFTDPDHKGLRLRVTPNGSKTWALLYRDDPMERSGVSPSANFQTRVLQMLGATPWSSGLRLRAVMTLPPAGQPSASLKQ